VPFQTRQSPVLNVELIKAKTYFVFDERIRLPDKGHMQKTTSPKKTEKIVFINNPRKQTWSFHFAFRFLYIAAIIFMICPFTDYAEENLHAEILKRVSMVNIDSIGAHLRRLQDFKTRYALSDSCRAAEKYLFEYFKNCGIDSVWYDTVFHNGTALRNVFASIKGNVDPDAVTILCAHIDATSDTPLVCAPGAEDNGSGVSVVMETARILADLKLPYTLLFVGFSGEDIGLVGSKATAESMIKSKKRICTLLNLDMVGWIGGAFGIKVLCDSSTIHLAKIEYDAALEYSNMLPEIVVRTPLPSDNYYFQIAGYPCLANIERFEHDSAGYRWYHTCEDTLGNLSLPLIQEVAKTVIATIIKIMEIPVPPANVEANLYAKDRIIKFSWDQNKEEDIKGYKAFWGMESGKYVDSAIADSASISVPVQNGDFLYFAVKSIDHENNQSWYSSELKVELNSEKRCESEKKISYRPFIIQNTAKGVNISYTLYERQLIELSIYDIRGRLVRRLVNSYQNAGTHSVFWDKRNSSGKAFGNILCIIKYRSGNLSREQRNHQETEKALIRCN
jgi:hypothetical protein